MYLQSAKICRNSFVIGIKGGSCAIALCIGVNKLAPPGMPKDACCSWPASCWKVCRVAARPFRIFLICMIIASHLAGGSWIVNASPSKL